MGFVFNGNKIAPTPSPSIKWSFPSWAGNWLPLVLGMTIATGSIIGYQRWTRPGPTPAPETDFFRLGQTYRTELARAYAPAWEAGASILERGEPVDKALDAVATEWESGRLKLFKQHLAPRFESIVPGGAEPTQAQRTLLIAAWRDLAKGLR
jgi:hypothetical protein